MEWMMRSIVGFKFLLIVAAMMGQLKDPAAQTIF
jgi:hypothetical protein